MSRNERYRSARLVRGTGRRPKKAGYWVEWDDRPGPDGRRRRHMIMLPTRQEAISFQRRKTAELNAALLGRRTWSQMVHDFDAANDELAEATQDEYLLTLKLFGELSGFPAADEISPQMVVRLVAKLGERLRPATVRKHLRNLRVFLRFGMRQEPPWFARDPSASVRAPKAPHSLRRVPPISDIASLLNATSRRTEPLLWYVLVRLAFETALRRGDLLGLRWDHMSYEESPGESPRLIIVQRQRKTGRESAWAVTRTAESAVERLRGFYGGQPGPFSHWHRWRREQWEALMRDAGVDIRFHSLRAAAATAVASAQMPLQVASRLLDHSMVTTTRRHYLDQVRFAIGIAQLLDQIVLPDPPEGSFGPERSAHSPTPAQP